MTRLVWRGEYSFELEHDAAAPGEPSVGEVAVRVTAVGVCATDIHILNGDFPLAQPPRVLGHEVAGVITGTGPNVKRVKAGDRVTIDQVVGCGHCFFCRRGSRQFCTAGYELGMTRDGGCQEFLVVPEENVYPIPDCISDEEAAILDMEVWGALHKCQVRKGDTVLVLGHGPAGMVACQIARAMGAGKMILGGRSAARMARAKALELADRYVSTSEEDLSAAVLQETGGNGADVTFECGGTPATVAAALAATTPGGRLVVYGVQKAPLERFDLNQIVVRDLVIYGALSDRFGWEQVIELVRSGKLRLKPLITHRFPLAAAPAAYDLVRKKSDGVVKAVIVL